MILSGGLYTKSAAKKKDLQHTLTTAGSGLMMRSLRKQD